MLDLSPDWSISQVLPAPHAGAHVYMWPGEKRVLPLRARLGAGLTQGTERLKVFATTESTRFQWLTLPPVADDSTPRGSDTPTNPLETLFAALAHDPQRHSRGPTLVSDWMVWDAEAIIIRDTP